MLDSDYVGRIVERVYEGIEDLEAWEIVLGTLSGAVGASCALIYTPAAPPSHQRGVWLHRNFDTSTFEQYVSHYVAKDLWRQAIIERNPREGQVLSDHKLLPAETFSRSEWFNDFLRPINIGGGALSVASRQSGMSDQLNIGFYRAVNSNPFRDEQCRALELIVGHFARAWKLRGLLLEARLNSNAADQGLELSDSGVIVVDTRGHIRSVNGKALEIFRRRDGLLDTDNEVSAIFERETRQLRAEIASIVDDPTNVRPAIRGPAISISRREGQAPYKVIVTRRPNNLRAPHFTTGDSIVLVSDPDRERWVLAERQRLAWALTPAEYEVVSEIITGGSIASHSRNRSISIETARWHLKNALAKAGLRTQRDLILAQATIPRM